MPEKFPLPEIKGRTEKSERDITQGKISQDGRIITWKKEGLPDSTVEGREKEKLQVINTRKKEEFHGQTQQKAPYIELTKPKPISYGRIPRPHKVKKERRMTMRAKKDLTSNESERYEALFNQ